jgi:hypothetical protein
MAWILLRKSDQAHLRGGLKALSLSLFADRFSPEVYLVRAISNLKLCYFDEVKKDFDAFISSNRVWAIKITEALAKQDSTEPRSKDWYSLLAEKRIENRALEVKRLEQLGTESVAAVLPAVGEQKHWVNSKNRILALLEEAKKIRADEYRRQWKSDKAELAEAIRKMQFVKVEAMTQMRLLSRANVSQESVKVASTDISSLKIGKSIHTSSGDQVFAFDGVIWPDEIFKLQSTAQGSCLK